MEKKISVNVLKDMIMDKENVEIVTRLAEREIVEVH